MVVFKSYEFFVFSTKSISTIYWEISNLGLENIQTYLGLFHLERREWNDNA